jgi:hypothetical protein
MQPITEESLRAYFKQDGDFIITKNEQELTLEENGEVWATRSLTKDNKSIHLDLITSYKDLNSFMQIADIRSIEDLHKIRSGCCWGQYLLGHGYVSALLFYYNSIDMNFRVREGITEISSLDLHFYDEVERTFSLPEHFIDYISRQWPKKGFIELKAEQFNMIRTP